MTQLTDNQRLKMIYDRLVKEGIVGTVTEFASRVSEPQPNISSMINGNRAVSNKVKQNVCNEFPISKSFMYDGVGEIIDESNPNKTNMDTSKEVLLLREQIAALNRHIASQEREIREHLRTIADLRRDITIDAQKETIDVLKEQKQDLQERLGFKHPSGETPANPHAGTLTKREGSATDKHKAGSNG